MNQTPQNLTKNLTTIQKLRRILSRREKIFLALLLVLSVIFSAVETIGISAIMPFISVATNPNLIIQNHYYAAAYDFFGFKTATSFVLFFGIFLIFFYIFRAAFSALYNYLLNRFAFGRFHLFSIRLLNAYINLPYKNFIAKNSATIYRNITTETQNLSLFIQNFLFLISEISTILMLYIFLLLVSVKMTLVMTFALGGLSFLLIKWLSKRIKIQGEIRTAANQSFYKILTETFGNFKIIKLIQNEKNVLENFTQESQKNARANIWYFTIANLPRGILETIGFCALIAAVLYVLINSGDANRVLPIISMYALALYKMLPSINRVISSYSAMIFWQKSLDIIVADLSEKPHSEGEKSVEFSREISLSGVGFEYERDKPVLNEINLTIKKGEKVAFMGESGGGKSTLVDIIIGLYRPNAGEIFIDDATLNSENIRAWRRKIGYIPQNIYLFDASVRENVAFGYEIDDEKVIECLKKANIYEFLAKKDGLDTAVGEGGIQLSGGQKQRIGIARALYGDPEILVLDEATSALDNETEGKIMDEIYAASGDKTLIIIAHRLSTLENCDRKIKIANGKIV